MTKRIVTHSGKFHTDDVFAVAAIRCHFGDVEIVRTRDEEIIKSADIVVDNGNVHDEDTRFDHHQPEGAGSRPNGVPYAAFGLVWKKWGSEIAGSDRVAEIIDSVLVQPIDGPDNGVDIYESRIPGVFPYTVGNIVDLFRPTTTEEEDYDTAFLTAVEWAEWVIKRMVKVVTDAQGAEDLIRRAYEEANDKRLVVFDLKNAYGREITTTHLMKFPEPLFAVLYRKDVDSWQVVTINESEGTFKARKTLPAGWAGKRDGELAEVTGVPDAIFCHNKLFMAVAKSKEGAVKLAELALAA